MIIGISGKKQNGKDTVANIIQYLTSGLQSTDVDFEEFQKRLPNYPNSYKSTWQKKQFAGKLKQIVALLIGCTVEQLENEEFKKKRLPVTWDRKELHRERTYITMDEKEEYPHIPFSSLSPRKLLQLMGTECGRDIIHPNIWVNALMADYRALDYQVGKVRGEYTPNFPKWIITDVRFPNELEAIKEKGGLVFRVNRPSITSTDNHPSETALDSYTQWDGVIFNDDIQSLIGQVQNYLYYYKIIKHENNN